MGWLARSSLAFAAVKTIELPMVNDTRELATYPQKRELILMAARPLQLETPMHVFNEGVFTPNDAFFVRWHLSNVPTRVDGATFRIKVHGRVKQPLDLSMKALQNDYEPIEIAAVCECSGNSRGFSIRACLAADNGQMVPWAMRCGRACACAMCSTRLA
jgi:DMSO/TMAO reductase YedYZ molybdopterin-dependent catalytic subunit